MANRASNLAAVLAEQVRPGAFAHERVLTVVEPLVSMLPSAGLRRGSTIALGGGAAMSLALALAAGPSAAGAWVAVVGIPSLGLAAASEAGLALERLFLVAAPPARHWAEVVAAAADGAELVLTCPPDHVRPAELRRVQSRLQARGSVLMIVAPAGVSTAAWGAELDCRAEPVAWEGLGEGHGRLLARRVELVVGGRRAGRPARRQFWLPGPDGRIAAVEPSPIALVGSDQEPDSGPRSGAGPSADQGPDQVRWAG